MLIGLMGPTDPYDLRREEIARAFGKQVFWFDELTCQFLRRLPLHYKGKRYEDLLRAEDRYGIVALKQKVEDAVQAIDPNLYTNWMTNRLATTVFKQGLQVSSKVTEAVIADIKYEAWAKWFVRFGVGRNNRLNKLVLVPSEGLPAPLCDHISENLTYEENQVLDLSVDLKSEVNRIRKAFYIE